MIPLPHWVDTATEAAKSGLKVIGGCAAAGAIYVKLGFPVPATTEYVDAKFGTLETTVKAVQGDVLTGQRKLLKADRTFLRIERMTVDAATKNAKPDSVDKRVLSRRLTEIDDQLTALGQEDDDLRLRIEKLK